MKIEFLKNVQTLEELKAEYKKLAMQHHPDCGGDLEIMKQINNEYDYLFEKVKNIHVNADGKQYTKETNEVPEYFKTIINELLKMKGIEIEIIGSFVWVSGNTKSYKDILKNKLNFKWHSKKIMWFKAPDGYRKKINKTYSIDEIRDMYGSQKIKKEDREQEKLSV